MALKAHEHSLRNIFDAFALGSGAHTSRDSSLTHRPPPATSGPLPVTVSLRTRAPCTTCIPTHHLTASYASDCSQVPSVMPSSRQSFWTSPSTSS